MPEQVPIPMVSVPSSDTAAVCVKSLPQESVAVVPTLMATLARIFPKNVELEPRVAEPAPMTQYTPAPAPVFCRTTVELLAVVSELANRKTHNALALPPPSRVRVVFKFVAETE
jgi:hypothetical protein